MKGGFTMKQVAIDIDHYEMLLRELETLHLVGKILIVYDKHKIHHQETLSLISKVVFKEFDLIDPKNSN